MPPKDYDVTNVLATNVEATNVEATKVEATNVEATNVEDTNVYAMYDAMYDNIPNLDNDEMIVRHLQILLRHYLMMLKT